MDVGILSDAFFKATGQINWFWHFYVIAVIAIIGWLASGKARMSKWLKTAVIAGYLSFAVMNVKGLHGAYKFCEAARLDLLAAMAKQGGAEHLTDVMEKASFADRTTITVVVHIVVATVLIVAILRTPGPEQRTN